MKALALQRLETPRMVASRISEGDLPELLGLVRDRRVAATLSLTGQPPGEAEVREGLIEAVGHWELHGFGLWLLRGRSGGRLVGRGGLQHTFVTGHDEVEVAWAIVPELWGRGLATELARASIEVAFGLLDLDQVIAYTLPHNWGSRRVMEKCGFTYDGRIEQQEVPHVLYRLNGRRFAADRVARLRKRKPL